MKYRPMLLSTLIVALLVTTSATALTSDTESSAESGTEIVPGILENFIDFDATAEILTGFIHSDAFFNIVYPTIHENLHWNKTETHNFLNKVTITGDQIRDLINHLSSFNSKDALQNIREIVTELVTGEMDYSEFKELMKEMGIPAYIRAVITESMFDDLVNILSLDFDNVYSYIKEKLTPPSPESYDNILTGNIDISSDINYSGSLYISDGTILNFTNDAIITCSGPIMIAGTVTLNGCASIHSVGSNSNISLGPATLAYSPTETMLVSEGTSMISYDCVIPDLDSDSEELLTVDISISTTGSLTFSGEGSFTTEYESSDEGMIIEFEYNVKELSKFCANKDSFSIAIIDLMIDGSTMLSDTDHVYCYIDNATITYDTGSLRLEQLKVYCGKTNTALFVSKMQGTFESGSDTFELMLDLGGISNTAGQINKTRVALDHMSLNKNGSNICQLNAFRMQMEIKHTISPAGKTIIFGDYQVSFDDFFYRKNIDGIDSSVTIIGTSLDAESSENGGIDAEFNMQNLTYWQGSNSIEIASFGMHIESDYNESFQLLLKLAESGFSRNLDNLIPEAVKIVLSNSESTIDAFVSKIEIQTEDYRLIIDGDSKSLSMNLNICTSIKTGAIPLNIDGGFELSDSASITFSAGDSNSGIVLSCSDLKVELEAVLETISLSSEDLAQTIWDSIEMGITGEATITGTAVSGEVSTAIKADTDIELGKEILKFEEDHAEINVSAIFSGLTSDIEFKGIQNGTESYVVFLYGTSYDPSTGIHNVGSSDATYVVDEDQITYDLKEGEMPAFSGIFVLDSYEMKYVPYGGIPGTGIVFITETFNATLPTGIAISDIASGTRIHLIPSEDSIGWSVNGSFIDCKITDFVSVCEDVTISTVIADKDHPIIESGNAIYNVQDQALIINDSDITQDVEHVIVCFPNGDEISIGSEDARAYIQNEEVTIYPWYTTFNETLSEDVPASLAASIFGSPCIVFHTEGNSENKVSFKISLNDLLPVGADVTKWSVYRICTDGNVEKMDSQIDDEGRLAFSCYSLDTFVLSDYQEPIVIPNYNGLKAASAILAGFLVLTCIFGSFVLEHRRV